MPYDIAIKAKGNYIRLEASGNRIPGKEVEDIIDVWSQVVDKCKENGISLILAIFKLNGRVPVLGSYEIAKRAAEFGWKSSFKLSIVDTNEESLKDNLFTETTATNRGYLIKVFDNEHDALKWLLDS